MERILSSELGGYVGKEIMVEGWVHRIRDLGKIKFIILQDRAGLMQIVAENQSIGDIRLESVIKVHGVVQESTKSINGYEVLSKEIEIISHSCYQELPFEINRENITANIDTILNNRILSLRNVKIHAIFIIQSQILNAFRLFFTNKGFIEINTPKIVASGTEGGTELFKVKYFEKDAYLAQSPQLYKQMMVGAGYERVFEIGHAYRAEEHNTSRHINEYVSLDVEMGFIEDEKELMVLETEFIKYLCSYLNKYCKKELETYHIEIEPFDNIPEITLDEARAIVKSEYDIKSPAGNLDPDGEKYICKYVKEKMNSDFMFITKYPVKKRPFYTMPDESMQYTKSFDLLYKGLEITTGGQRIHDYVMLLNNIKKFNLNHDNFKEYLNFFKFGMPPHGGFAIGLERLTMKLLDLKNIREACLLPRDRTRLCP